jgi:hypothetical protein
VVAAAAVPVVAAAPRPRPVEANIQANAMVKNTSMAGVEGQTSLSDEPLAGGPIAFSVPLVVPDTVPDRVTNKDVRQPIPGFLGKAVGSVHSSLDYWKKTFEQDAYVENIILNGYKIPVKMSAEEAATRYRRRTTAAPVPRWSLSA